MAAIWTTAQVLDTATKIQQVLNRAAQKLYLARRATLFTPKNLKSKTLKGAPRYRGSNMKIKPLHYLQLIIALSTPSAFAEQIFKCKDSSGKTTFAYVPCTEPDGESASVTLKINRVGSMATPEQIEAQNAKRNEPPTKPKVSVVYDSSGEDTRTHSGRINKRLRESQEMADAANGDISSLREPMDTATKIRTIKKNEEITKSGNQ